MEYKSETKSCQNCKNDFIIEPDDFSFYEKIKVPPPTFCPDCRRQRRMSWRNDFTFYNRNCDFCQKGIISLYSQDKPEVVYCNKCWWSDSWDPFIYGRTFNFSKSFFEQFRELQTSVPIISLMNDNNIGSINSEYTQNEAYAKNCYMVSMAWKNEDCLYSYGISGPQAIEIVDSMDIFQSERIYESIFLNKSYDCSFCYYSANLVSCNFCLDCRNLSNSFMCVGLNEGEYLFKNQKYSKEEYEKILDSYNLNSYYGQQKAIAEFEEFCKNFAEREPYMINCVNCVGDGLLNSKNAQKVFTARRCHNVKFFENGNDIKDGYDMLVGGENELCYEGITPDNDTKTLFSIFSYKNNEVTYVEHCYSSFELFGCVGLKHAQYCILNKQYSKEEYFDLKNKIIQHMKKTGEWGEFFPSKYSHFAYNETIAQDNFPLQKEEILAKSWSWKEDLQKTTGKETILIQALPDKIKDVNNELQNEILKCIECDRNYKIINQELTFYKKMLLPIPRKCFYCRHKNRIQKRQKRNFS